MRIAVIGYGVVGRHMAADIERAGHSLIIYDPYIERYAGTRPDVNLCDAAFVCVSTPQAPDGSCDLSAIRDVFSWLAVPVAIVRSTVPPGTTATLARAVFVPEFIGEGVNAPYLVMRQPPFVIIGGEPEMCQRAGQVFQSLYNSECELIYVDSTTAELAKYAENYFLALKVTWANELYDIAQNVGANFEQMISAVTHDYRIGRAHTHVYHNNRGWSGRCLPKDTAALLSLVGEDTAPLLAAVRRVNDLHRAKNV